MFGLASSTVTWKGISAELVKLPSANTEVASLKHSLGKVPRVLRSARKLTQQGLLLVQVIAAGTLSLARPNRGSAATRATHATN